MCRPRFKKKGAYRADQTSKVGAFRADRTVKWAVCARMSTPKMFTSIMSIPKMSIPIMSIAPKYIFP